MQTIESLTELLRMEHEQIGTEVAKNAEFKEALSFCLPHAAWALQGQMFNKSIIQAKQLLERDPS